MSIVAVILDTDKLLQASDKSQAVDEVSEYTQACLSLREAATTSQPLTLHVTNRSVAVWLTQVAGMYGDDRVTVVATTPRSILADRLAMAIPADVTDTEIRQSKLLDETIATREGQGFWSMIVEHFYGDAYCSLKFEPAQLAALIDQFDPIRWRAAAERPIAARAFKTRIENWEKTASQDAAKTLVRRLRDDPSALRRDLCHYKVLRNYPISLGRTVLGDAWDVFKKARVDVADLALSSKEQNLVTKDVVYYLTSCKAAITTPGDLDVVLKSVSGCLYEEYAFVAELIKSHLEWLTTDLLRKVESTFRSIQSQAGQSLAQLRQLIRPAFPIPPEASWTAARWLTWVTSDYMPYYSWLEAADQSDETVKVYATSFADWYHDQFNTLKYSEDDKFAFTALYQNRKLMADSNAVTLVLLVDNFNYVHFEDLVRLFSRRDFTLQASEPRLSLVPTATEVGKAGLIACYGDQADLPSTSYPKLVKEIWKDVLKNKNCTYLPNIGELQLLSAREHDVYFVNYLTIDKALHDDTKETGRSHADTIRADLQILTDSVATFAAKFNIHDRLVVFTLSDHGSTRIARESVNVLDQDFFKKLSTEKHHRFVSLSDEAFKKLPQVAGAQCYLIDRHKFKTNQNYLAARSYYRFIDTSDTFYVHGGLTPEEVVVPFARFALKPVAPNMPTVRLLKTEYRYSKKAPVEIQIGNPNPYSFDLVSLRIIDQDSEDVVLNSLSANSAETVGLPTIFRKVPGEGNSRSITLRVRFECQGREFFAPDTQFDITLKSLMEVTDDFEF